MLFNLEKKKENLEKKTHTPDCFSLKNHGHSV